MGTHSNQKDVKPHKKAKVYLDGQWDVHVLCPKDSAVWTVAAGVCIDALHAGVT